MSDCRAGFFHSREIRPQPTEPHMDPQTLPAATRELYQAIKRQYHVHFEPLDINDIRLYILKITDLEQILDGKDPLKNVSDFPFWIRLWEGALVLARFLADQPFAPTTRILELGAGLGAPGLTLAARGYQVTLSDYEDLILDFERVSAAASGLETVHFQKLDWLRPPDMDRYDVIIGAEILFREEFFQPLLEIFDRSLTPEGTIYLAHDIRRQSLKPFFQRAEKTFQIAASRRKLKSLEKDTDVLLTRLTRRF